MYKYTKFTEYCTYNIRHIETSSLSSLIVFYTFNQYIFLRIMLLCYVSLLIWIVPEKDHRSEPNSVCVLTYLAKKQILIIQWIQ